MTCVLYGIKNCDTVRKARAWLDDRGIAYRFHDFRDDGLDPAVLDQWLQQHGWEQVINRRSTSWKALDDEVRDAMNLERARESILASPTLIKRPVLSRDDLLEFGFKADRYADLLS